MRVCVIGLGYVGLTLAVYLAKKGLRVHGVDVSDIVLDSLSQGSAHFFETDFDSQLKAVIENEQFTFSDHIQVSPKEKTVYIITVGTPLAKDGHVNLQPIKAVCGSLKEFLKDDDLVILRSTLRVGVTRDVVKSELDNTGAKYHLAFCPERTLEGSAFEELASLPQIVSGIDSGSLKDVEEFFAPVSSETVALSSVEEAEMVKLLNNSERDLMFALANEIALMCDSKGLDAYKIINAANYKYPRSSIKKPGPVGGPCLEKDPHILTEGFLDEDYTPWLFKQSRAVNESMVEISLKRVFKHLDDVLQDGPKNIALLGMAFKGCPPTGDMRGSLIYSIIDVIKDQYPYVRLVGHDYLADHQEMHEAGVTVADTVAHAVEGADLVVLQNNHPSYKDEKWSELESTLACNAVVFDFWNQLDWNDCLSTTNYQVFGAVGNE